MSHLFISMSKINWEYREEMKKKIQSLIDKCYPTFRIAKTLGLTDRTIRVWLTKLNLIPAKDGILIKDGKRFKRCPKCNLVKESSNFNSKKSGSGIRSWCISCEVRIRWEKHRGFKQKCVEYKGGKCQICGYNQCLSAMDFHHINSEEKDYQISEIRCKPWEIVQLELDKTILLCRNCHAELHEKEGWKDGNLLHERRKKRMV